MPHASYFKFVFIFDDISFCFLSRLFAVTKVFFLWVIVKMPRYSRLYYCWPLLLVWLFPVIGWPSHKMWSANEACNVISLCVCFFVRCKNFWEIVIKVMTAIHLPNFLTWCHQQYVTSCLISFCCKMLFHCYYWHITILWLCCITERNMTEYS